MARQQLEVGAELAQRVEGIDVEIILRPAREIGEMGRERRAEGFNGIGRRAPGEMARHQPLGDGERIDLDRRRRQLDEFCIGQQRVGLAVAPRLGKQPVEIRAGQLEEDDLLLAGRGGLPAELLVETARPRDIRDAERHDAEPRGKAVFRHLSFPDRACCAAQ